MNNVVNENEGAIHSASFSLETKRIIPLYEDPNFFNQIKVPFVFHMVLTFFSDRNRSD